MATAWAKSAMMVGSRAVTDKRLGRVLGVCPAWGSLRSRAAGLALATAIVSLPLAARADEAQPGSRSQVALGAEVDLLPLVLSASAGKLGGGVNLWAGVGQVRLRLVGSYIAFPHGALTPSGFDDRRLTVAAGIVDVFFLPAFSGPWIGTGVERWWNGIRSASGPGSANWSAWVYTLGAGYVWKVWATSTSTPGRPATSSCRNRS